MVNHLTTSLDSVFGALANPARRNIIAALTRGRRAVSELAQPSGMSLPGFLKHVRVLEGAGLIVSHKQGRVVHCTLNAAVMRDASDWLDRYRQFWEERLDALERYLEKETATWRKSETRPRSRSSASSKPRRRRSGVRSRSRTR
ncbi:MAG TPA: metalloregulator ArsR/SmtB family transcription factor [Burkholderiales bacterium]|nr:metalloregulator ArsR/SmtB family transcription factor [Burkholderiales bacterium]